MEKKMEKNKYVFVIEGTNKSINIKTKKYEKEKNKIVKGFILKNGKYISEKESDYTMPYPGIFHEDLDKELQSEFSKKLNKQARLSFKKGKCCLIFNPQIDDFHKEYMEKWLSIASKVVERKKILFKKFN
jgi:plasmid maintenance system killer protein